MRLLLPTTLLCAAAVLAACGSDDPETRPDVADGGGDVASDVTTDAQDADAGDAASDASDAASDADGDTDGGAPLGPRFAFGLDPDQPISSAPFPFDLYLADGLVRIAPLGDDPRLGSVAAPEQLAKWTQIANTRRGFGFGTPVWFFSDAAVDASSVEGRARIITLSGPEAGREVTARAFVFAPAGFVGVAADYGDYMMPDSTYGVLLSRGITSEDGTPFDRPFELVNVWNGQAEGAVADAFAPLVAWFEAHPDEDADAYVAATVFTTEPIVDVAQAVFTGVDGYTLRNPTLQTRWDVDEAAWVTSAPVVGAEALDAYFGAATAASSIYPGVWYDGHPAALADLTGTDVSSAGNTHTHIAAVLNGSIRVPSFNMASDGTSRALVVNRGAAEAAAESIVPFTIFLCDGMDTAPADLPVIVFSHGGGANRTDALAVANMGCVAGMATVAIDMVFHGGRFNTAASEPGVYAPITVDNYNDYTNLSAGAPGFVPDGIGDHLSAAASVSKMYAVEFGLDPDIIVANLLTPSADTYTLLRYLREANWDEVWDGLSFDGDRIVQTSLSFGTAFHTPLFALADLAGAVISVGSGNILGGNLTSAPTNGAQGSALIFAALGLQSRPVELQSLGIDDPGMSLIGWLHQAGDPLAWTPYILRHRLDGEPFALLSTGDSWDETLSTPQQLTFDAAIGAPAWTAGPMWTLDPTVPGAANLDAPPFAGAETVTYDGVTHTAGRFYYADPCHGLFVVNVCDQNYERGYPPIVPLASEFSTLSPICAVQTQTLAFLSGIVDGSGPTIIAPSGDCETLYGD